MSGTTFIILFVLLIIDSIFSKVKNIRKKGFETSSRYSRMLLLLISFATYFNDVIDILIEYKNLFVFFISLCIIIAFIYLNYRIYTRTQINLRYISFYDVRKIVTESLNKYNIPYKIKVEELEKKAYINIEDDKGRIKITKRGFLNDIYEIVFIKMNNYPHTYDVIDTLDELYIENREKKKNNTIANVLLLLFLFALLIGTIYIYFMQDSIFINFFL